MRKEQILYALEHIEEDYIADAASTINFEKSGNKRHKVQILKWSAVAACLALVCYMGSHFRAGSRLTPIETDPELPLLEVSLEDEGMGFEAHMFYDISESDNQNPWTEDAALETLPVYQNLAYSNESGEPVYLSEEQRNHIKEKYEMTGLDEQAEISVSGNGTVKIEFLNPIKLSLESFFTDAERSKTVNYLNEKFSGIFDFEEYEISIWSEYTFQGESQRLYKIYEKDSDLVEEILNFNFKSISFVPNMQEELSYIRIEDLLSAAEKIGDYPIITWKDAQKLLLDGNYFTTVPDEYLQNGKISKNQVKKIELIYRTGNINKVFMPYYRFYVELPEIEEIELAKGLKMYGIYYVPAVYEEYLKF